MPENGDTTSNGNGSRLNPFARHESHSSRAIILYRITTFLSYLILLITAIYYTFAPHTHHNNDKHSNPNKHHHHETPNHPSNPHHHPTPIWSQNRPSPFAQNSILTSLYWLALFLLQLVYAWALWTSNNTYLTPAANIASHYIASNLLLFGFIHLFVRAYPWLALLLLVINFFNLSILYFRHSTTPRLLHIGVVSGPLAWNFVALYWVGALAVGAHNLPARIVGNIFIWGFLAYGAFFLAAFKDYTIGFALSILSFSTAVGQFLTRIPILQLQWIFAFTIGGLLFILSLAVGVPGLLGRDPFKRGEIVSEDRERAPLLADD